MVSVLVRMKKEKIPQSIPGLWGSDGELARGAELLKTKDPVAIQTAGLAERERKGAEIQRGLYIQSKNRHPRQDGFFPRQF